MPIRKYPINLAKLYYSSGRQDSKKDSIATRPLRSRGKPKTDLMDRADHLWDMAQIVSRSTETKDIPDTLQVQLIKAGQWSVRKRSLHSTFLLGRDRCIGGL